MATNQHNAATLHTDHHAPSNPASTHNTPSGITGGVSSRAINLLREEVGSERVDRLLGDGRGSCDACLRDADDGVLEVRVPDRFRAELIERRLGEALRRSARRAAQEAGRTDDCQVRIRVDASDAGDTTCARFGSGPSAPTVPGRGIEPGSAGSLGISIGQVPPGARRHHPKPATGVPEYVIGDPNRVAFEACRRAVCEPDGPQLVFVHGPCGVGKTHLLRKAASMCRLARRDARIRTTSGEAFIGGYVHASREKAVQAFQRKHRRLDLLIIDDVHAVAGKEGTQQELVRTLSELQLAGARVIVASDAHPREIARVQAALASRFVSGVVAPVGRPDEDMVRRLIPSLATRRGLTLDPRGLELLTSRVLEDTLATPRDIEGTLTQVQAIGNLMDRDRALFLSADHVRRAVEMRAGERHGIRRGPVGIETIIDAVCAELGVERPDLGGSGRAKKVVLAREVIVHLGKRHTGRSYPELAMALGRPNHSTVITAHNRFRTKLEKEEPVRVGCSADGCPAGELVGRIERAMGL